MKALVGKQRSRSRYLRREQTEAEARLWFHLRSCQLAGAKFRRQQPLGAFVVDFFCMEVGLIVEVDSGQHIEREQADARRTERLEQKGFRVLRFWNDEALRNTGGVLEQISIAVDQCRREGRRWGRCARFGPAESPSP